MLLFFSNSSEDKDVFLCEKEDVFFCQKLPKNQAKSAFKR